MRTCEKEGIWGRERNGVDRSILWVVHLSLASDAGFTPMAESKLLDEDCTWWFSKLICV